MRDPARHLAPCRALLSSQQIAGRFVKTSAGLEFGAGGLEIGRHSIETIDQTRKLIDCLYIYAVGEIAFADLLGGMQQRRHGSADLPRKKLRQPARDKENKQRN